MLPLLLAYSLDDVGSDSVRKKIKWMCLIVIIKTARIIVMMLRINFFHFIHLILRLGVFSPLFSEFEKLLHQGAHCAQIGLKTSRMI